MKYKDYYNFKLGNRDIYSHNDILGMTVQDLFDNELPLSYQYNTIGIPKDDELTASPNTHQYTNANGKLRWRSSCKTTEELLEEERKRNQELQAQTEAAQSQLGTITGNHASVSNTPKQAVESPMMESEPLFDKQSLQAMGGLINKAKEKIQAKKEANAQADAELYDLLLGSPEDYMEETKPNPLDPIAQESDSKQSHSTGDLQDILGKELSADELAQVGQKINALYKDTVKNAPQMLKGGVVEEVGKPNLLERIKNKVNEFKEVGLNKNDNMNLNEEFQKFLYTNQLARIIAPMSSRGVSNAIDNFKDAKKNKGITIYDSLESMDDAKTKKNNIQGFEDKKILEYDKDTYESKSFTNSPELKRFIEENKESIKNGTLGPVVLDFGVNKNDSKMQKILKTINPRSVDRAHYIQHATLFDHNIDENGLYTGKIGDVYDFARRDNTIKNIPNNWGFEQQQKGNLENYAMLLNISREMEEAKKRKRKKK